MSNFPVLKPLSHEGKSYTKGSKLRLSDSAQIIALQVCGAIGQEGDKPLEVEGEEELFEDPLE